MYLFPELERAIGEEAAEACATAAEPSWDREGATAFVLDYIQSHGPCGGEEAVNAAIEAGFAAPDSRAFGVVMAGLSRAGKIRCVGYGMRAKGHGTSGLRIWEAVQ